MTEPARPEPARPEPARPDPARPDPARPKPARPEPARPEPVDPPAGRNPEAVGEPVTLFTRVGGRPCFDRLVGRFYDGVAADPLLRPMYPDDLTGSRAHLAGFLAQYWGGGTVQYSDARGHPRLRMRHAPFAIGATEAAAWLAHMEAAVAAEDLPEEVAGALLEYFTSAASHMVNTA